MAIAFRTPFTIHRVSHPHPLWSHPSAHVTVGCPHVLSGSHNADGDGEDEEAFEKRLAALKSKRGTPSRSSGGGGDGALTPYQQLKQNQADEKDRKKSGVLQRSIFRLAVCIRPPRQIVIMTCISGVCSVWQVIHALTFLKVTPGFGTFRRQRAAGLRSRGGQVRRTSAPG